MPKVANQWRQIFVHYVTIASLDKKMTESNKVRAAAQAEEGFYLAQFHNGHKL